MATSCYYQLCKNEPNTKEHIPPRSFFPKDQRDQLLTVPSCEEHNNAKSTDDTYILAQMCLNASPSNRSREVFQKVIVPQLGYNNDALRKHLLADAQPMPDGAVSYKVNVKRFDSFFSALSCGIVFKSCGVQLPADYRIRHVYHNFRDDDESLQEAELHRVIESFYSKNPTDIMDFGTVKALNASVYSVKLFGISEFRSSITIVHNFYGMFRVTSMLSKIPHVNTRSD